MKFLLFILLCFLTFAANAQNSFPEDWIGSYSGKMKMSYLGHKNDTVDVDFVIKEVEKDSIWTYTMTYNSDKWGTVVKDYRYVAEKKGDFTNFIFDELNGIQMKMTLFDNCFYGMYEVMNGMYISTLRKIGNDLFFELFSASMENPFITRTEPDEKGETIEAKSMKPMLVQSVLLHRKSTED